MIIRNCPRCGIPVNGMTRCPICGTPVDPEERAKESNRQLKKAGSIKITPWEVAFIIVLNLAFICIVVNSITGGPAWFHYPVLLMIAVYFLSFTFASKTVNKFITRYRNTVLALDLMVAICTLVFNALNHTSVTWTLDYFIPINLLTANALVLGLLFFANVPIHRVLVAGITFSAQSFILFVALLFGRVGSDIIPRTLIILAFGINLLTVINIAIIYAIKFRNEVFDGLHLWE